MLYCSNMSKVNDIRSHSHFQKQQLVWPFPCGGMCASSAGKRFNGECMNTKETRALPKGLRPDIHTWLSAVSLSSLSWSKTASPGGQTYKRLLWRASQDGTSTGANMKQVNIYRRAAWWHFLLQPVPSAAFRRAPPGVSCPAPRPELHPAGIGPKRLRCAAQPAVRKTHFLQFTGCRKWNLSSQDCQKRRCDCSRAQVSVSHFCFRELMSVQSCVWFPPRSSGFVPAAPSLQLRHCFYGWTVGGQPSRRQTAPPHYQIHQQILQFKYTVTPKNRHSSPHLLQDYFQSALEKIIFFWWTHNNKARSMIRCFYKEFLLFPPYCPVTLLVQLFLVHKEWKRLRFVIHLLLTMSDITISQIP